MNEQNGNPVAHFGPQMTVRWSCRKGDFLAWFRWRGIFGNPENSVDMLDVWEMRSGDFVTITNRTDDLPRWFELHPTEVCNHLAYEMAAKLNKGYRPSGIMDGPNLWRIRGGDRLAWIGEQRADIQPQGHVLAVLDFDNPALAVGETNRNQTMEDAIAFGSLTPEGQEPQNAAKVHEAVLMVRKMGIPRTLDMDWQLG